MSSDAWVHPPPFRALRYLWRRLILSGNHVPWGTIIWFWISYRLKNVEVLVHVTSIRHGTVAQSWPKFKKYIKYANYFLDIFSGFLQYLIWILKNFRSIGSYFYFLHHVNCRDVSKLVDIVPSNSCFSTKSQPNSAQWS